MRYMENFYLLAVISVFCWITPTSPCPPSPKENMENTNKSKFAQFSTADFLRTRQGTDSGQSTWGWLRLTRREGCSLQSGHDRSKCWDLMHCLNWLQFLSFPCRQQGKLGRAGCLSFGRWICADKSLAEVWSRGRLWRSLRAGGAGVWILLKQEVWTNLTLLGVGGHLSRAVAYQGDLRRGVGQSGVDFPSQQPGKEKELPQSTDLLVESSFAQGYAVSLTRF